MKRRKLQEHYRAISPTWACGPEPFGLTLAGQVVGTKARAVSNDTWVLTSQSRSALDSIEAQIKTIRRPDRRGEPPRR